MAHLAVVGSHAVNGVAELHTDLLKRDVLSDFPRCPRALQQQDQRRHAPPLAPRLQPRLSRLITEPIGDEWVTDLDRARETRAVRDDAASWRRWPRSSARTRRIRPHQSASVTGLSFDPDAIFDVQIKRLHEYKRQLLNALHIVALYLGAKRGERVPAADVLFGAKAAPGYRQAKLIIRLINAIADVVNGDPMPGASRSRSSRTTASRSPSDHPGRRPLRADLHRRHGGLGTGNMKLAMNGALTIGTLDGANIEIREAVGAENFFLFGLTAGRGD